MRSVGVLLGIMLGIVLLGPGASGEANEAVESTGVPVAPAAGSHPEAAGAGMPPWSDGVLTLEEAWQLAEERSMVLAAAASRTSAAKMAHRATLSDHLPRVTATARYTRLSDMGDQEIEIPGMGSFALSESFTDTYGLGLELDQPLFSGLSLTASRRMARHGLEASRQQERLQALELREALEEVYLGALAALGAVEAVEDGLATLESHRSTVDRMVEVGLATRLDLARIETRLAELETSRIEATSTIRLARLALISLTGIDPAARFRLEPPPVGTEELPDEPFALAMLEQTLTDLALGGRPEILALEQAAGIAREAVRLEDSAFFPSVGLHVGFQYDRPNERAFPPTDEFEESWDATIGLGWRLWDSGASLHRSKAARRRRDAARLELEEARRLVRLEIQARLEDLMAARQRIEAARRAGVAATENLRVAEERYAVGDATSTDVLDAQGARTADRLKEIQAMVDARLAATRLAKASGMMIDELLPGRGNPPTGPQMEEPGSAEPERGEQSGAEGAPGSEPEHPEQPEKPEQPAGAGTPEQPEQPEVSPEGGLSSRA